MAAAVFVIDAFELGFAKEHLAQSAEKIVQVANDAEVAVEGVEVEAGEAVIDELTEWKTEQLRDFA